MTATRGHSARDWMNREIFSAHGHMNVEQEMAGLRQSEISHPGEASYPGGITASRTGIGLRCQSGRIVKAHPADGGSASSPPTMPTPMSADPSPGGFTDGHVARGHP